MNRVAPVILVLACSIAFAPAQRTFKPSQKELSEAYSRAEEFEKLAENAVFNASITFGWIENSAALWYRRDMPDGKREFVRIDSPSGKRAPAFDHSKLAAALGSLMSREFKGEALPFNTIAFQPTGVVEFPVEGTRYEFNPADNSVKKSASERPIGEFQTLLESEPNPEFPAPYFGKYQGRGQQEERIRVRDGQLELRADGTWTIVTTKGSYARGNIDPDSGKIIGFRLIPGERRPVYLLKSAISGSTRAVLEQRLYDQPGDRLDEFEVWIIDPATKSETKLDIAPIMGGGQPWANPPGIRWKSGRAFFDFPIRGYQEHKLVVVDMATGTLRTLVHEKSPTFIDQSKTNYWFLNEGKRLVWQSERSGRSHLYMVDIDSGEIKPITSGDYIVRAATMIETDGRILLGASGFGDPSKEDPYHTHLCAVDLDGGNFKRLTTADAHHNIQFSPDFKLFLDSYSRTDSSPVHELRDSKTGELVALVDKADIVRASKNGIRLPERFVAKGRDGKTDIWGVVIKPSNFDKNRKYPVIENIYAGPHDSFVPKGYRPFFNMHRLAELGFIVVQIDGMGTNNRGKAFHDVAWKNVADAGFPDRILWMQALAKKMPQADITRVGVFGTSAGGQSSTGAMLFHPEFYKVAVSSCGCHDNRIDKQWWNEQWMGYPVGPHYDAQSNITNAAKLKGRLMLIVGEQDRNVPPESTFRLADALVKARKEFELVVIPGADHTDGGPYGNRKRMDFFVRWLHGVEPPRSND
jgi:dipeptidyl aminopeptidase/acylaminoacyl peptidase